MERSMFHVKDWQAAEENAADWMRRWGWPDARTTGAGADGGIDVVATGAAAQVKFEAHQTSRPQVQNLVGAAATYGRNLALLFFTGTNYSVSAIGYAEAAGVALFKYDPVGNVNAVTSRADVLVRGAEEQLRRAEVGSLSAEEPRSSRETDELVARWEAGKPERQRRWLEDLRRRGSLGGTTSSGVLRQVEEQLPLRQADEVARWAAGEADRHNRWLADLSRRPQPGGQQPRV